jgi:hypothetical protein
MKHSKHLKFLFTALLLLCCSAAGAQTFTAGGVAYSVTSDGKQVKVRVYKKSGAEVK